MARWETHQADSNAAELYQAARKLGFSVQVVNRPIDAIFGIYDQTVAIEVKTATGKIEPSQRTFFRTFKGHKAIVRTQGDLVALYRELRRRHDAIFAATHTEAEHGQEGEGQEGEGSEHETQVGIAQGHRRPRRR